MSSLTPFERSILEVERRPWKYAGAKAGFILEWLGLSETHYYARLNYDEAWRP